MKPQHIIVLNRSECSHREADGAPSLFVQGGWKYRMRTVCFFPRLLAASLFVVTWLALSNPALAYYTSSQVGNDISYPQCSANNSPQNAFGIVGVTGGRAFTGNACLSKEFTWASTLTSPRSLYMNLNIPIGLTASQGMTGPYGNCAQNQPLCQSENYGYNAAQYAFNYAANQHISSPMWWLDIEVANSWSPNPILNQATINGAADFFTGRSGMAVGIYSTPNM